MNALRKTVSAVSALAIVVSTMAPALSVNAASEFVPYADALANAGVVNKVASTDEYRLGDSLTRAEMAKVAINLKRLKDTSLALENCTGTVFGDVDASLGDLCQYIETAASIGMVSMANANYRPKDNVTRAEMVKMLLVSQGVAPTDVDAGFSDVAGLGDLTGYINAAAAAGIVSKNASFRPNANANRGEAFKVAANAAGLTSVSVDTDTDTDGDTDVEDDFNLDDLFGDDDTVDTDTDMDTDTDTDTDTSTDTDGDTTVASGDIEISLSALTPVSQSIPKNGSKVYIMAVDFTAGDEDAKISNVVFKHVGLSSRSNIDKLWVEVDGIRLTSPRSINSDNLVNMPLSTPYTVRAGETITAKVYMSMVSSNTTTGDQISFELSEVETTGGEVLGLPVVSNSFTTSNYSLTPLKITSTSTTTTVDVGSENIDLSNNIQLENRGSSANSNVDLVVKQIIFRNNGSANLDQLENVGVYDATNTKISDEVAYDGNDLVVSFGTGYTVPKGNIKNVTLRGDVASAEQGRTTFSFEVRRAEDVDVVEATTEFGASVTFEDGTSESVGGKTINLGRITITRDSSTPSSTTMVPNTKNITALVAKMIVSESVRSQNGVRIFVNGVTGSTKTFETFEDNVDRIKVYYNNQLLDDITPSSSSYFDISGNARTQALTSAITDAGYQTTTSFDIPAGTGELKVVVDFKNNTDTTEYTSYQFSVKEASFNDGLEYISSGRKVDTTSASIGDASTSTTDIVGTATSSNLAIGDSKISVTKADSIGSRTVVRNTTLELARLRFSNTDIDEVVITSISMDFAGITADGGDSDTNKIFFNNVVARADNMTGTILSSSPLTSVKKTDANRTMSLTNFRIPKSGSKELSIVGTVESSDFVSTNADDVNVTVDGIVAQFANNSGNPAPSSVSIASATFTYATSGQLTGIDSQHNVSDTILVGSSTEQTLGIFNVRADVDDLKLTGVSFANLARQANSTAISEDTDLSSYTSPTILHTDAVGTDDGVIGKVVTAVTSDAGDQGYVIDNQGTIFGGLSLEISTNGVNGTYTKVADLDYNNGMMYRIDTTGQDSNATYANSKITSSSAIVPAKNNNVYLRVRGTLNVPTTDNSLSGRHVKLLMNRIVLESASTGDALSTDYTKATSATDTLALDSNIGKLFVLRKSRPNFSTPSTANGTLTTSKSDIFKFTMTPDSAGQISLGRLVFRIDGKIAGTNIDEVGFDATGAQSTAIFCTADDDGNGTADQTNNGDCADGGLETSARLSNFTLAVNGSDATTTNSLKYYALRISGVNYLVVDFTQRLSFSSATSFALQAQASAANSNDLVQVSIPKLAGTTYRTAATPANVVGGTRAPAAYNTAAQATASVIWSDQTNVSHGNDSADYTNDLFVSDGTDVVSSQSLQRN
ncbi:MAG TPA: S-layer homology domain-containing protein [bacterium]|nr:S-layer homology domain-containing protein [bacterium]